MIAIPAMYPFPGIRFSDNVPTEVLTDLAGILKVIHVNGEINALCWQVSELTDNYDMRVCFADAMSYALYPHAFATSWAEASYGLDWHDSVSYRPAWAKHIADHIEKELNK